MRHAFAPLTPYARLARFMGGSPEVMVHANDLGSGTAATWPGRPGTITGTAANTPAINATGWTGGGGATFKTLDLNGSTQTVSFDAEAANYNAASSLMWIIAGRFTASAAGRNVLFLGNSANGNNYRGLTVNATD